MWAKIIKLVCYNAAFAWLIQSCWFSSIKISFFAPRIAGICLASVCWGDLLYVTSYIPSGTFSELTRLGLQIAEPVWEIFKYCGYFFVDKSWEWCTTPNSTTSPVSPPRVPRSWVVTLRTASNTIVSFVATIHAVYIVCRKPLSGVYECKYWLFYVNKYYKLKIISKSKPCDYC